MKPPTIKSMTSELLKLVLHPRDTGLLYLFSCYSFLTSTGSHFHVICLYIQNNLHPPIMTIIPFKKKKSRNTTFL